MSVRSLQWSAAALATGLLTASASAATWSPAADGNWNNATQWGGDVPDTNVEDAVINVNSGTPYTITVDDSYTLNNMTFSAQRATIEIVAGGHLTMAALSPFAGSIANPSTLKVNGGSFTAASIFGSVGGLLLFDGGPTASSVASTYYILNDSKAELNSGTINLASVFLTGGYQSTDGTYLKVQGATVTAANVSMDRTGGIGFGGFVEVSSGSLTASGSGIFGMKKPGTNPDDAYTLRIKDTGAVSYAGTVIAGGGGNARGVVDIQGGTFTTNNLLVGRTTTAGTDVAQHGGSGQGYYNQTGGVATVNGTLTLYTEHVTTNGTDNFTNGTRQFVVADGSSLTLTGAGFAKSGTTDWLITSADVDLGGTIAFDPADGITTQKLLVFGSDQGTSAAGLVDNFAIGTLDLTQLVTKGATLNIEAAAAGRVLYVDSLLGLSSAQDVSDHLLGTNMIVYYDVQNSPGLSGDYTFGTNSQLRAIPEPASLGLLTLGFGLIAARRRH